MATLGDRVKAAMSAFSGGMPTVSAEPSRYDTLYAFWAGEWLISTVMQDTRKDRPPVYKNLRQVWRQASAVVALYTQFVYQGDLSTDGQPLPDGTRGAIPIDPQGMNESQSDQLRLAIATWWTMTNYRQFMSMRPKFGAILGDCLTELIDDRERGIVRPQLVWPGYVKHLDLDLASNVKAYSIEYPVDLPETKLFGETQEAQHYMYRKDVNGEGYWFYQDDVLVRHFPNPYGFVPAVWDRHEIVFGDRGLSAIEKTYQQAIEINSVLSGAIDYQQKKFGAPIGVVGTAIGGRNNLLEAIKPKKNATTGDPLADGAMLASSLGLLPMTDNGKFLTVEMDPGKTTELLSLVQDSLLAENPEARYSQQILEMTQVTAPGVERALGPIIGLVKDARKNYDTQTIKLLQMAVSMMGFRVRNGGYPPDILTKRRDRYNAFAPYDLPSFDLGLLDFTIPDREVIPDTVDERIARQLQIEQLTWEYSLQVSGVPEDVIATVLADREAEKSRMDALTNLAAVAGGDNEPVPALGAGGDNGSGGQ